jgi:hypothetical protein
MNGYQYNRACACTRCRSRGILGPVVLIAFGVLLLLHNLDVPGFSFERTWPVILLVIGGVKLLQSNAPIHDHVASVSPSAGPNRTGSPPEPLPPPSSDEVRNV